MGRTESIESLIAEYEEELLKFPRPQNRTEFMEGTYTTLEKVIKHLKILIKAV